MNAKRLVPLLLVVVGLAAYEAVFFAVRLPSWEDALARSAPSQEDAKEPVFRRVEVFRYLVLPEDLLDAWCGSPPEFSLLDRLPLVAVAGGILGWAGALGWLLLVGVRADRGLTRVETLVFSIAVGLNVVSTLVLAAGLCGWLRSRMVFLFAAAITVAGAAALAWRRRRQPTGPTRPGSEPAARPAPPATCPSPPLLSPHWLWLAVPFVLIIVLGGMLPPADFDVREYHLQAPKEFFQQGQITFLPNNVYANMPLGAEMLCLLGMAITGDWWLGALAGKTVIALMAPLTALGLWTAGRRFLSPTAGVVAAVVYVSIPWIIQVSTAGLIDAAMGCYLMLATYAVILATTPKAHDLQPVGLMVLSGYLAGSAVSCKYTAVVFVAIPLLVWIVAATLLGGGGSRTIARLRGSIGAALARAACFGLAVLVGCGLWFGKNWSLTGNPTYPLAYSVFGGKTWNATKDQQWNAVHRSGDFSLASVRSAVARVTMTSEWLSPLVMPLAALAFVIRRKGIVWALARYFVVVVAAWWLLTHRLDRFWIPALPLAALVAGAGAGWSTERWWRWTLGGLLVLGTTFCFLTAASVGGGYTSYFISLDHARNDPYRVDPIHRYLNRTARQGCVLLVGDAQPFDLQMPVLYNTCFDDSVFEQLVKDRSPEEIRAAFAERDIGYVLVNWSEVRRYQRTYEITRFIKSDVFYELVHDGILALDRGLADEAGVPTDVAALYRVARHDASSASKR